LNLPARPGERRPGAPITAEPWGAAALLTPAEARLRDYLRRGDNPLWNPYQGLGQPYAAQGDGNPYAPGAIARALLPPRHGNLITLLGFGIASIFFYLFLRQLGLAPESSAFGAAAFCLSPVLSFHIPRWNIADQNAFIPILVWSAVRALRSDRGLAHVVFAAVTGLTLIAGFVQAAVLTVAMALVFGLFYLGHTVADWRSYALRVGRFTVFLGGGAALAAPLLYLMIELLRVGFYKNTLTAYSPPYPIFNLVAFFFPSLYGTPLEPSALGSSLGSGTWPVDWGNLFACASILILMLCLVGALATDWGQGPRRRLFWFFAGAGTFLLLRYMSLPPFTWVDVLPALGYQTPKHANALCAWCFLTAASIALDAHAGWHYRRVRAVVVGVLLFAVAMGTHPYVSKAVENQDWGLPLSSFTPVTVVVTLVLGLVLLFTLRRNGPSDSRAKFVIALAAVAELTLYLPLGTAGRPYLYLRAGIFVSLVLGALFLWPGNLAPSGTPVRFKAGLSRAAGVVMTGAALLGFGFVVASPPSGLPRRAGPPAAPACAPFLTGAAVPNYRSFGIFPDYSSLIQVQDVGVVGPFATSEFAGFVKLAGGDLISSEFMLAGRRNYPIEHYLSHKDCFDWLSVRYLVLEKGWFQGGSRHDQPLLDTRAGIGLAYQDAEFTIYESRDATPRAVFCPRFGMRHSQAAVLKALQANPKAIQGLPLVESGEYDGPVPDPSASPSPDSPVTITESRPNRVSLSLNASSAGLVILKDSHYPGWTARVDGRPAKVLRVNGMVRGVFLDQPGEHRVQFTYQPRSFRDGLCLAGVSLLFLLAVAALVGTRALHHTRWVLPAGALFLLFALWSTGRGFASYAERSPAAFRLGPEEQVQAYDARAVQRVSYHVEFASKGTALRGRPVKLPSFHRDQETLQLMVGDIFLDNRGRLLEIGPDGRCVPLVAREGQVVDLVGWPDGPGKPTPAQPLVYRNRSWELVPSPPTAHQE
jgi:hypothetical protein